MSGKDYSLTPLSRKLGAKPGAGVLVFFTTSRTDLERRFEVEVRTRTDATVAADIVITIGENTPRLTPPT